MNSSSSSDKLVEDMLRHLELPSPTLVDRDSNSDVARFYKNRSVFITGATGFIGKALIEKFIRSCPDIERIYILVREKRGKGIQERLKDLVKSQFFDRARELNGGSDEYLLSKLHAIHGDITLPKFGISEEDLRLLSEKCTIVYNSAATIRFVEPLDIAVQNNIYSVGQLIEFCDELEHLEAIVHLSTAYSNCHKRDTIHEIFYEPPMRGEQIQETVEKLKSIQGQVHEYKEDLNSNNDQAQLSRSSCKLQRFYFDKTTSRGNKADIPTGSENSELLKEFTDIALKLSNRPNTYTFTKAISENYLLDKVKARPDRYLGNKIPVAIIRPSIVGGAWREPQVGLVDNFNGPTGAILSLYTGALQAMPGNGNSIADLVPVDMVTNMVLCTGWYLVSQQQHKLGDEDLGIKSDFGVYIFNFTSGSRNPLHWQVVTKNIASIAHKYPSKFLTRIPSSYFIRAGRFYDLYDLINQKFPAFLMDLVRSKLFGQQLDRKTSAMSAYTRIRQMTDTLTPFTSNQWKFTDSNVQNLFSLLGPTDKQVFHFDVDSISWQKYIKSYIIGSRIYTLKDEPKNVTKALESIKRRKLINNTAIIIFVVMICYFFLANLLF